MINKKFKINVGINPNKVEAINSGSYTLTFKDGQVLNFNWPNVKIHGILTSEPNYFFVDTFDVTDVANGIQAKANFIRTRAKGLMGSMFGKKKEAPKTNQVELKLVKIGSGNTPDEVIDLGV